MSDAVDDQQSARALAVRLMGEGNYAAAASALYRGLGADPRDLSLLASLGRACLRAGWAEEAARIFRTCTERRREPAYLDGLGTALAALDRPQEAERYLCEAVRRDPLLVDAWAGLGRLGRLRGADPLRAALERVAGDEALTAPLRDLLRTVLDAGLNAGPRAVPGAGPAAGPGAAPPAAAAGGASAGDGAVVEVATTCAAASDAAAGHAAAKDAAANDATAHGTTAQDTAARDSAARDSAGQPAATAIRGAADAS